MNKKGKEDDIEIFNNNKNTFVEISSSFIQLGYEMSIVKKSGKIFVEQNGNVTAFSEYPIDYETKSNIE